MIDQPTIDRILDAAQIVDIVSDFVTLRKRGVNYVGLCPFHDDKHPSMKLDKRYYCFGCGEKGDLLCRNGNFKGKFIFCFNFSNY